MKATTPKKPKPKPKPKPSSGMVAALSDKPKGGY
tara:strand:- start:201 stop:302 length:102 start_codon:yes stop_codon:yes gene_type:complete